LVRRLCSVTATGATVPFRRHYSAVPSRGHLSSSLERHFSRLCPSPCVTFDIITMASGDLGIVQYLIKKIKYF